MTLQPAVGTEVPANFMGTSALLLYFNSSSVWKLLFTQPWCYFYISLKSLPDPSPLKRVLINPIIMAGMQETARVGREWGTRSPTAVTILA